MTMRETVSGGMTRLHENEKNNAAKDSKKKLIQIVILV